MSEIINKVASSGLMTIDLAEFLPEDEIAVLDLKDLLWQEMVLREKDFREFISTNDWSTYQDQFVAVFCSADAIIPDWAYMLAASALSPFARRVYAGTPDEMRTLLLCEAIQQLDTDIYLDTRVVVKGCGDVKIPAAAFVTLVNVLQPVTKSIMYGEPCSTVPVYKQKRK